jgi:hypothetical protein
VTGVPQGVMNVIPLRRRFRLGPKDRVDKAKITLVTGQAVEVEADPAFPMTPPEEETQLVVPVLSLLYGWRECGPCEVVCPPIGAQQIVQQLQGDPTLRAQLRALLGG